MAPFLSIVTRHMVSRPAWYAEHCASLDNQTCQDYEHVVITDEVGRGLQWANGQLYEHRDAPQGEYVLILDDDDQLADPGAVATLKAAVSGADVLVFKGEHGPRLGTLPTSLVWGKEPVFGHISAQDFIVRREVWRRHIAAFARPIAGDYSFLTALWEHGGYSVQWLDRVLVKAGHHFGAAE